MVCWLQSAKFGRVSSEIYSSTFEGKKINISKLIWHIFKKVNSNYFVLYLDVYMNQHEQNKPKEKQIWVNSWSKPRAVPHISIVSFHRSPSTPSGIYRNIDNPLFVRQLRRRPRQLQICSAMWPPTIYLSIGDASIVVCR